MIRFPGLFLPLALTCMLAGCGGRDPRFSETQYLGGFRGDQQAGRAPYDDISYWDGDGAHGAPAIRIDLGEQRAYFYKGGELVGISTISTGREGYSTPTGRYRILDKNIDHVSSIYGNYVDAATGEPVRKDIDRRKDPMPRGTKYDGASMPYFMRFHGGIGMHEGFLPGYAASHGCIRMPGFMAERFYANVSIGTSVTVTP